MKLTKLFALFLVLTVVFTLVACSNGNNDDSLRSQQGTDAPLTRDEDTSIDIDSIMNVQEQKIGNMVIYSFTAENTDGYTISIASANGTNTLVISK